MIKKAEEILKKYYGYRAFKNGQDKVISNILSGKDTLAILPTGAGKSICFQIPALLFDGITIVISPLISLMKNQVDSLNSIEMPATFINSSLDFMEIENRIYLAEKNKYKILYIAPERLSSPKFIALLKNLKVSLLVVDEAHCISQWGHDFRPSYLSIGPLIKELPDKPVIGAFTATATEEVKKDIIKLLSMEKGNIYIGGFNRENLYLSLVKGENKMDFILKYLRNNRGNNGIIYCATRKEVDHIHDVLKLKGYRSGKYHAGLSDRERSRYQEHFSNDNIDIMVATNAFGLGIDKSNIRFIIHNNMPMSIEAYYQEAGRAGRDGEPAECMLLFSPQDIHIQKFLIEKDEKAPELKAADYKKLNFIINYGTTSGCLRKYILEYFGEKDVPEGCGNCSNCNNESEVSDITIDAQKILSCIYRMKENYGISLVADVLKGAKNEKVTGNNFQTLSTYGIMKEYSLKEIKEIINFLIIEKYISRTDGVYPLLKIGEYGMEVLKNQRQVMRKTIKIKKQELSEDKDLFNLLRSLRKEIAEKEDVPPYVIFHDSTLIEMSKYLPRTEDSLRSISGIGDAKLKKYGNQFLTVIRDYLARDKSTRNPRKAETPSHIITCDMYKSGKSIEEIAKERDLKIITIQDHIIRASEEGIDVDLNNLIPEKYKDLIMKAIEKLGTDKLRPIKDALPDDVDYMAIKAAIQVHLNSATLF
jgi:ATP-dependent DNA helicase RecQ